MSHYVYHNLQATEISKLQLIIALYVVYVWLIVFILTSWTFCTQFSVASKSISLHHIDEKLIAVESIIIETHLVILKKCPAAAKEDGLLTDCSSSCSSA